MLRPKLVLLLTNILPELSLCLSFCFCFCFPVLKRHCVFYTSTIPEVTWYKYRTYIYIYIYISKVGEHSWGWPKGSFFNSYLLHQGVEKGATPFPGLLHFTLDLYNIILSVKQGCIKYHFLSLWYDSPGPWVNINHYANAYIYIYIYILSSTDRLFRSIRTLQCG